MTTDTMSTQEHLEVITAFSRRLLRLLGLRLWKSSKVPPVVHVMRVVPALPPSVFAVLIARESVAAIVSAGDVCRRPSSASS